MGSGKGKARRARSQALVKTGAGAAYQPRARVVVADPGRDWNDRSEAFDEVLRIIEELRVAGLREEALRVLYTSANLLYNSRSVGDRDAQRAITDFHNLLEMIEEARPGAMIGNFAYPGETPRLRQAFAACSPPLDVLA